MKPHVSKPTQPTNVITLQRKKEREVVGYDMTSLKSGKHGRERLLQNEFKCLSFFPVLLVVGNGWPFLKVPHKVSVTALQMYFSFSKC